MSELTTNAVNYICGRLDGWRVPRTDDGIAWKIWMPGSTPYGYYKSADDMAERFPAYCSEWGAAGPLLDQWLEFQSHTTITLEGLNGETTLRWRVGFIYGKCAPESIARAYVEAAKRGWLGPESQETASKAVEEWEAISNEQS